MQLSNQTADLFGLDSTIQLVAFLAIVSWIDNNEGNNKLRKFYALLISEFFYRF